MKRTKRDQSAGSATRLCRRTVNVSCKFQSLIERVRGLGVKPLDHLTVSVNRCRDGYIANSFLDNFNMHATAEQNGAAGVAELFERQSRKPGAVRDLAEFMAQRRRHDGPIERIRGQQGVVVLGVADVSDPRPLGAPLSSGTIVFLAVGYRLRFKVPRDMIKVQKRQALDSVLRLLKCGLGSRPPTEK